MALLTYNQAAKQLGIAASTLRAQAAYGKLETTTLNGRTYIAEEIVEDYARRQRERRELKRILQELLAGALDRPDGVQDDDWLVMKWYVRDNTTMQQIATHYKTTRQRIEQRIRRGLTAAGALDKAA